MLFFFFFFFLLLKPPTILVRYKARSQESIQILNMGDEISVTYAVNSSSKQLHQRGLESGVDLGFNSDISTSILAARPKNDPF